MTLARILPFLAVICSSGSQAIEITDFKFGLVCPNARSRVGWVCHETKDILITGQGECVFSGQKSPCTWYGFSFNYTNARASDVFHCTVTSSLPRNLGNPDGVVGKDAKVGKYDFTVPESSGAFFNPQYSVFAVAEKGPETNREHTECTVNGKAAFSFDANYIFPGRWGLTP